jgi:hypothetical protein
MPCSVMTRTDVGQARALTHAYPLFSHAADAIPVLVRQNQERCARTILVPQQFRRQGSNPKKLASSLARSLDHALRHQEPNEQKK